MRNLSFSRPTHRLACLIASSALLLTAAACDEKPSGSVEAKENALPLLQPWPAGKSQSFTFSLTSSTSLGAMPTTGTVELAGKVVVFAVASNAGGMKLIFEPSEVALLRPQRAGDTAVTQLREDVERAFAVELKNGVISSYFEPEESSLLAFGLRRQLAVMSQRAQPSKPTGGSWSGMEWDASGQAKVNYTRDANAPGMFAWKKTGYETVLSNSASHAALKEQSWKPEIVDSSGHLHVDDGGVVSVERSEVLQTQMTRDQHLRTSYTSKLIRLTAAKNASAPKVDNLTQRKAGDPPPKMDTSSLDAIRFAGRSWDEVVGSLPTKKSSTSGSQKDFGTRQAAFHALVGLFRTDEENIKKAMALVEKKDPRSSTLLRALASASTESSLAALSKVSFDQKRPSAERRSAASTFLRAEMPPPSVLDTLIRFLDDPELRETGLLGLGTFSRLWRAAEHNDVADRAVARLELELGKAKSAEQKSECLYAIANAGDPRFFDQVVLLQDSQDSQVRKAAIQAVRLMKDKRVEPRLVELLKKNPKPDEVLVILTALAQRKTIEETTVALVELQTKAEVDVEIRRQAAITLGVWGSTSPHALQLLKKVAQSDADARVREAAQLKSM